MTNGGRPPSRELASIEDGLADEIHRMLDGCYKRARDMLVANREILEDMAKTLLEREVLDGEQMGSYLLRVTQGRELAEAPSPEYRRPPLPPI